MSPAYHKYNLSGESRFILTRACVSVCDTAKVREKLKTYCCDAAEIWEPFIQIQAAITSTATKCLWSTYLRPTMLQVSLSSSLLQTWCLAVCSLLAANIKGAHTELISRGHLYNNIFAQSQWCTFDLEQWPIMLCVWHSVGFFPLLYICMLYIQRNINWQLLLKATSCPIQPPHPTPNCLYFITYYSNRGNREAAILILTPGNKRVTSRIIQMSALAHLTGIKMVTANNTLGEEIILNYSDFDYQYESAARIFFLFLSLYLCICILIAVLSVTQETSN